MAKKSKEWPWRTIAIVFIALFVIETLFLLFMLNIGSELVEKENECAINVCGSDEFTAFYYDDFENICYCYTGDEIAYQQFLG